MPPATRDVDELIESVTVDCYGDDEELGAFLQAFEDELTLPAEMSVAGVPVDVVAVERASVLTLLLQEHPQLLDRPSMRRSTDPCSEDSESLMPEKKTYGKTKSGIDITDELIEQYVAEAEKGYDLDKLRPRGRPSMGSAPARSFPVRLDPELRAALDDRAGQEGRPASDIVREALRQYLGAAD